MQPQSTTRNSTLRTESTRSCSSASGSTGPFNIGSSRGPLVLALGTLVILSGCVGGDGKGSTNAGASSDPGASFAPYGGEYRTAHFREDGSTTLGGNASTSLTLPVQFTAPTRAAGQLSYTLGGDAIEGLHYAIDAGSESPLNTTKSAMGSSVGLTIDPQGLAGTRWFKEKLCRLTLTGGSNVRLQGPTDFRLHIRSTAPVPTLAFSVAADTGNSGGNPNTLQVLQSALSEEPTTVYYNLAGTAVEGVDYSIAPGSESGALTIPAGALSVDLDMTINASADGSGRTILLSLDHEEQDGTNENHWTHSGGWDLDGSQPYYAGDPSTTDAGGGQLSSQAPAGTVGLDVVAQQAPSPKLGPDGTPLEGVVQSQYMQEAGFALVKNADGQLLCGGPVTLNTLSAYTRMSVYVETFLAPELWRNSTFVKLNLLNRTKTINHRVIFRRGDSADEVRYDWRGSDSWGVPVSTPTGFWGLWRVRDIEGEYWGRDFGVRTEVVNGQTLTRLWHTHFADGQTFFHNNSGLLTTETLGSDLIQPVLRLTHFSTTDGSSMITGGDLANRGKGLLAFWPLLELSDTALSRFPGRYWEKPSGFWEPRGNACMNSAADIVSSTFTIQ